MMRCRRYALPLLLGLAASGVVPAVAAPAVRTVIDQAGHQVAVPMAARRIADLWYAHNEVLIMLGAGPSIAVTVDRPSTTPWMFRVAPELNRAIQLASPTPTAEALLAAGVDLAFVPGNARPEADTLRRVGIPTLQVMFTGGASLMRCLAVTADALNTDRARTTAARYDAYLTSTVANLRAVTDRFAPASRPRVLHIMSLSPLRVDGADTVIDDWISIAGGRNAAAGLVGNMKPVSLEQVVAWNPDIIILGGEAGPLDAATADPLWRSVKAVQDGRVYRNPAGVYEWDRYGAEYALQMQWAAKTLHPELFAGIDMVALSRAFYRDFFSYPLTADEAQRILAAQPPA